jgi:hypothetical protein
MALQIAMCCILLYPFYASLVECKKVFKKDYSSFTAGTLIKILPAWAVNLFMILVSVAIVLLGILIMIMKPYHV